MSVKCCLCGELANGRYCFLNWSEVVVDNPFCHHHSIEVWNQTKKSLNVMHNKGSINREFALRQSFPEGKEPPPMPADKLSLLMKGAYVH